MGVINLGALVEKLRKKLSGDFVKTTDYATTSKAGIIKVGDGLSMNATTHKLSVTASAGMVKDTLFTGTADTKDTEYDITYPSGKTLSDYKFFIVVGNFVSYPRECGSVIVDCGMISGETASKWCIGNFPGTNRHYIEFEFNTSGTKFTPTKIESGSDATEIVAIYGIR